MLSLNAEAKLQRAVSYIYNEFPFFAVLVARWKFGETTRLTQTMATDGVRLLWNREFVDKCSIAETCFVLLHEAGHCFLGHHLRLQGKDPYLGNVAGDLALNSLIKTYRPQNWTMPMLMPGEREFADLVKWPHDREMEFYYEQLVSDEKSRPDSQGEPQNQPDEDQKSEGEMEEGQEPGMDSGPDGDDSRSDTPDGESGNGLAAEGESDGQADSDGQEAGELNEDSTGSAGSPGSADGDSQADAEADGGAGNQNTPAQAADNQGAGSHREPAEQGAAVATSERAASLRASIGDIPGEVLPHPDSQDPEKLSQLEEEWHLTVAQGINAAKMQGNLPGWLKEIAERLYGGQSQNWKLLLRRFLTESARNRYTYQRPSRKHAYRKDCILPGRGGKTAGKGRIIIDTSGSMSIEEMNQVLTEVEAILRAYPDCEVVLMMCDTRVADEKRYTRYDFPLRFPVEWKGRGGTDLKPALEMVRFDRQCKWCMILSDMYWDVCNAPNPGIPTLWLSTQIAPAELDDYSRPKFGTVIGPVVQS